MSVPALAPTRIRRLVESRPPTVPWPAAAALPTVVPATDQPMLELGEPDPVATAQPAAPGVRGTLVRARWVARPRRGLPDACAWSSALVVAIVQALLAQRPIAQLNRWLADDVLGAVALQQRRRRAQSYRGVVPVGLRSLRVQHPGPEVAEVSAHVLVGNRSTPLALRLEALGDRWLCVALELDLRVLR